MLVYLALDFISFSLDCSSSAEEIDSHSRKNRTLRSIWFGAWLTDGRFASKRGSLVHLDPQDVVAYM